MVRLRRRQRRWRDFPSETDRQVLDTRLWCDAKADGAGRCRRRDDGPCMGELTTRGSCEY
ncbi:hypothetical protein DLJ47_19135 [Micromonospora sp. S4605]|nr:hypothetical protein DLJ47_19135 [Micromonospora sp. S4605]